MVEHVFAMVSVITEMYGPVVVDAIRKRLARADIEGAWSAELFDIGVAIQGVDKAETLHSL